jgi:hypothetical protein
MTCPSYESWIEALDGGASAPDGAHVKCATCAASRRSAERLLGLLREAVAESTLYDEAFVKRVLRNRRPWFSTWTFAMLPVAAAAALVFWTGKRDATTDHPVARGGAPLCEVRQVSGRGLRPLGPGTTLPADASLAFAVRNPAPRDQWLGIFAITAGGKVAWYHPRYDDAAARPSLLKVAPGRRVLEEQVSLPLGSGEVRVFCWLSERAWSVPEADRAIEAAVAAAKEPMALERIPAIGGRQEGVRLWFGGR